MNTVTGELGEAKVVTGVDDHSRYCVIAAVVARATGRAVCAAFAAALKEFGVPEEVLTDNGKQFTDPFGFDGEVLFDRICRDNAITHRLTRPASPTTTGKVERFHLTLRREFLDDAGPFPSLTEAQAALDTWVSEYNTARPHRSLQMAYPVQKFRAVPEAERALLPLRLPAVLNPAAALPAPGTDPAPEPAAREPLPLQTGVAVSIETPAPAVISPYLGGPIEFDRVVPASGNLSVSGRQFWLGPARAGVVVTFWADSDVIHLLAGGTRIKTLRSHLSVNDLGALAAAGARSAGPSPLPSAEAGQALEIERMVRRNGLISVGDKQILAAEILAGQRVGIRIEPTMLLIFDLATRELLRTKAHHMTYDQARRLRGARPAGPPPAPPTAPVRVQRRASDTGTIVIAWQKLSLGRHNAGRTVTAHVSDTTIVVDLGDDTRTFARTNSNPASWTKAHRPRKAATVS